MAETLDSMETSKREYPYDAVIILGGGLKKVGDRFYPTDYRDSDEFGMLGASMRMVAAIDLYLNHHARNFVFSTGVTEKNRSKFGPNIPTEAQTYKDKFLKVLRSFRRRSDYKDHFQNLEEPNILLEDRSFNTFTNIDQILQIINKNSWARVAIVSNKYHIPRIQALYEQALRRHPELKTQVDYLPAEWVVEQVEPGKYDQVIERYYRTPEAKKRISNEEKGVADIKAEEYVSGEFQENRKS